MSKKKEFFFNPNNPSKSFDVYKDKNPKDTVNIAYSNKKQVEQTINKIERLYKNGKITHKRAVQISMILMIRTRVIAEKNKSIDKGRSGLAKKYFEWLKEKRTPKKNETERKKLKFF
tara:strand:- start:127 stop:477 length:351 start_codon:yes stop_codon:yes gene_type:complete